MALEMLERARRAGLELRVEGGALVVRGASRHEALARELLEGQAEILLELGRASNLVEQAAAHAQIVRFTVRETEDVEGDVAFLRRVRAIIEEWGIVDGVAGANRIEFTIVTLSGERRRFWWSALATSELRTGLGALLAERGLAVRDGTPQ